jgi:hypothetical protein
MFSFLRAHARARHITKQEMDEHSYRLGDMIGFPIAKAKFCPDCELVYLGAACIQCGSYHGQVEMSSLMPWAAKPKRRKHAKSNVEIQPA